MIVMDYILTILITAIVVILVLYLFFFKSIYKTIKGDLVAFYTEKEMGLKEGIDEVDEIEEKKEDYGSNLVKKE